MQAASNSIYQQHIAAFGDAHALGEDIRTEARAAQDSQWQHAVQDGRAHVSHREANLTHAVRLSQSIRAYHCIEALVDCHTGQCAAAGGRANPLYRVPVYLVREVADYCFPAHGSLVMASVERRKVQVQQQGQGQQLPSFRLCVRKRPLLPYEHISATNSYNNTGTGTGTSGSGVSVSDSGGDSGVSISHLKMKAAPASPDAASAVYIPYDACSVPSQPLNSNSCVLLHDGRIARNGRRLSMTHHSVHVHRVHAEGVSNAEFCAEELEPLLRHIVPAAAPAPVAEGGTETDFSRGSRGSRGSGGVSGDSGPGKSANVICFGQTGTGKTYTLQACLTYLCSFLMGVEPEPPVASAGSGSDTGTAATATAASEAEEKRRQLRQAYAGCSLEVTFYEVHGKQCYDLLNGRKVCKLLADGSDVMHLRGAKALHFEAAPVGQESDAVSSFRADLMKTQLAQALQLRSAEVTERNPVSSRSHAVCEIRITFADAAATAIEAADNESGSGRIRLVDLAGSERNYETLQMTAKQHLESADINTALMALKDCFRATAAKTKGQGLQVSASKQYLHAEKQVEARAHVTTTTAAGTGTGAPKTRRKAKAANVHVPFRAHLLTRVLKDAFSLDSANSQQQQQQTRTTVVATVSPSPIDLIHSLNTLEHSALMSPALEACKSAATVEVPLFDVGRSRDTRMEQWSPRAVRAPLCPVPLCPVPLCPITQLLTIHPG